MPPKSEALGQDCVHVLAYIRANEGFSKEEALKIRKLESMSF